MVKSFTITEKNICPSKLQIDSDLVLFVLMSKILIYVAWIFVSINFCTAMPCNSIMPILCSII